MSHESTNQLFDGETSKQVPRTRLKPLALLLATAVALFAANLYDQHQLRLQAETLAQVCADENALPESEMASLTTVGRDYLLLGAPYAKIELFQRVSKPGRALDIQGIEYHYRKIDGEWVLQDSGRCAGGACAIRGRDAFAKRKGE